MAEIRWNAAKRQLEGARSAAAGGPTRAALQAYDTALSELHQWSWLHDTDSDTNVLLANAHLERGQLRAAFEDSNGAMADAEMGESLAPETAKVVYDSGRVMAMAQRFADALPRYDRALQLGFHRAGTLNARGFAKLQLGRAQDAIEDLSESLAIRPDDVRTLRNLASAFHADGRSDEANRMFEECLRLAPGDPATLFMRGELAFKERRFAAAAEDLARAVELRPLDLDSRRLLVASYVGMEANDAALEHSNEILRSERAGAKDLMVRAIIHSQSGDAAAARRDIDDASARAPDDPKIREWSERIRGTAESAGK